MRTLFFAMLSAGFFAGCISVPPPSNRSAADPADPSSPEAGSSRYRPNLIASTRVFLDPSVGEGAQKMDHSKMQGMGGMEGMDHSKMQGMEAMDDSKMQGTGGMEGMDHSKMPAMKHDAEPSKGTAAQPADKEATVEEMKKTGDEMKKASDELKAKSDALQKRRGTKPGAAPAPQQAKPEDHSQHQQ